jgi:adenine-specific DNA-methyltransferase
MNYIGSKRKLNSFLKSIIYSVVGDDLSDKVFCDIFAGTGIVGRNFKPEVKKIIANDFEYYSYVLIRNYIGNHTALKNANEYLVKLNELPLLDTGFIYRNYCTGSGSGRQYFSDSNGKKLMQFVKKLMN